MKRDPVRATLTAVHPMTEGVALAEPQARWFGSYLLLEPLPAYGMVQPWVAREEGRVGLCVVKRLLPALEGSPTAIARFAREAKIGAILHHPNIVPMIGHGVEGHAGYLALDFLVAEPLGNLLGALTRSHSRMPLTIFHSIVLSVLDALSYAHNARAADGTPLGIIHRDLTPRNIQLTYSGEIKVSDFGVAKLQADDFKTVPGIAVGTIEYLSPEQVTHQTIDARSDLYTFSCVLYEMLSGRPVIPPGTATVAALSLVASVEPTPLASLRPDLSPRLVGAIERGMAKDREQRFSSAAEMRAVLSGAVSERPANPEMISSFMRGLLPDGEARVLNLIDRIRLLEANAPDRPSQLSADGRVQPGELERASPSQLSTMIVRQRSTPAGGPDSDEPPEPSVMTMPGTLVRGGEPAPMPRVVTLRSPSLSGREQLPQPVERRRPMLPIALIAAAVVLVALMVVAKSRSPEPMAVGEGASTPVVAEVHPTVEVAAAPMHAQADPTKEVVPETKAAETKTLPAKRRVAPVISKEPSEAVAAPPPPPASPPPAPPKETAYSGLRRQIRSLIAAAPKRDVRSFMAVHKALSDLSKDLPEPTRIKVDFDLQGAERTLDPERLDKVLDRIEKSKD